jgi:Tfp pilus assembly protein PilN
MIPSINLAPEPCRRRLAARRRLRLWAVLLAGAGLASLAAVVTGRAARGSVARASARLAAALEAETTTMSRLVQARQRMDETLGAARRLADCVQADTTHAELETFCRLAPEGVVFTHVAIAVGKDAPPAILVAGYAVSHEDLNQMLSALQRSDAWKEVNLRRAAQERFQESEALAFRIECRRGEARP